MTAEQSASLIRLINIWQPAFDARVDPRELRLRAAAVIISLATGPYRGQEPNWEAETRAMLNAAEGLVRLRHDRALTRAATVASGRYL